MGNKSLFVANTLHKIALIDLYWSEELEVWSISDVTKDVTGFFEFPVFPV